MEGWADEAGLETDQRRVSVPKGIHGSPGQGEEGTTEAKVTWRGRGSWVTKVVKRKAPVTHNTGNFSGLDTPAFADVASGKKDLSK